MGRLQPGGKQVDDRSLVGVVEYCDIFIAIYLVLSVQLEKFAWLRNFVVQRKASQLNETLAVAPSGWERRSKRMVMKYVSL